MSTPLIVWILGLLIALYSFGHLLRWAKSATTLTLVLVGFAIVALVAGTVGFRRLLHASNREVDETSSGAVQAEAERADLVARFGEDLATRIIAHQVWIGATTEMVLASLGAPALTQERVMKTKVKHVMKYGPQGRNRFALSVTLEDGLVTSWVGETPGAQIVLAVTKR